MIIKCKTIKYYPLKVKGGFVLARTNESQKSLGFATFRTQKVAIASGKIWYGKFLGYEPLTFGCKL